LTNNALVLLVLFLKELEQEEPWKFTPHLLAEFIGESKKLYRPRLLLFWISKEEELWLREG